MILVLLIALLTRIVTGNRNEEGTLYLFPDQPYILELNDPNEEVLLTRSGPDNVEVSHRDPNTQQWSTPTPLAKDAGNYNVTPQSSNSRSYAQNPSTYSSQQPQGDLYFGPSSAGNAGSGFQNTAQNVGYQDASYAQPISFAPQQQDYNSYAANPSFVGGGLIASNGGGGVSRGGTTSGGDGSTSGANQPGSGGSSAVGASGSGSADGKKSDGKSSSSKDKDKDSKSKSKDSKSSSSDKKSGSSAKKKNSGAGVCMGTVGIAVLTVMCSMIMF